MAVHQVDVFQFFYILDQADPHRAWGHASDTLFFTQGGSLAKVHGYAADLLAFTQTAGLTGDQQRSVSQTLVFTEHAARRRDGYVYQNFVIAQSAGVGRPLDDSQTLAFTQTATIGVVRAAADVLAFTETVVVGFVRVLHASDTLVFDEGATAFSPVESFFGTPLPGIVPAPTVTLTSPAGSVTLPAPDFGNTESLGQTRVSRNSRGGTFIIFRAPFWPTTDEFSVTFSYLSAAEVARLRYVVSGPGAPGQLCTYTDHEGRSRTVIVTNPEFDATQSGRFNYVVNLRFQTAS